MAFKYCIVWQCNIGKISHFYYLKSPSRTNGQNLVGYRFCVSIRETLIKELSENETDEL